MRMSTNSDSNLGSGLADRPLRRLQCALMVCCLSAFCALAGSAQDLGEAARQERQRKQVVLSPSVHVYSNDDLKKLEILVPADRQRFEESRKNGSLPETGRESQGEDADAGTSAPEPLSLGEVARLQRAQKQEEETKQQFTVKLPAMPLGALAAPLAAPKRRELPQFQAVPTKLRPAMVRVPRARLAVRPSSLPVSPAAKGVFIKRGETLWGIARLYLGSGLRWHELLAANPGIHDPNRIRQATWIALPS